MTDSQRSVVIRATARIQEADEPTRQRPIIKTTPGDHTNIDSATQLANAIRASIDSGRDNPFRPDGEIYKLTNPIVDYYKFGANQSRSQTPTYAELVDETRDSGKKRRNNNHHHLEGSGTKSTTRPWWRRWLCCCCCCRCCPGNDNATGELKATTNGGSHDERTAALNGTSTGPTSDQQAPAKRKNNTEKEKKKKKKKKTKSNDLTTLTLPKVDATRSDSGGQQQHQQVNSKKQAKVVLVDVGTDDEHETADRADAAERAPAKRRAKQEDNDDDRAAVAQVTQVKNTDSRCVIS